MRDERGCGTRSCLLLLIFGSLSALTGNHMFLGRAFFGLSASAVQFFCLGKVANEDAERKDGHEANKGDR